MPNLDTASSPTLPLEPPEKNTPSPCPLEDEPKAEASADLSAHDDPTGDLSIHTSVHGSDHAFVYAAAEEKTEEERKTEEQEEYEYYDLRCYRIYPSTLKDEEQYLRVHGVKSCHALMWQALERLYVTRELLEMADSDSPLPSGFLPMLGRHLGHDLGILERIAFLMGEMELVYIRSYRRP